jgi:S-DNA-T family DNA segregation ATPase FtsK/SpoIIIE
MRFTATVRLDATRTSDVVVDVEPDTTLKALAEALGKAVGQQPAGLWSGGMRLEDDATVEQARLGEGALVALIASAPSDLPAFGTRGWQLHVIAGRQVGTVWDLPIGLHELGRTAALRLDDERASRVHARIQVTAAGATLVDAGSSNGTMLDGQPVETTAHVLGPGMMIEIGDSLLTVAVAVEPDAAVQPGRDGLVEFTRSPRIQPMRPPSRVVLPTKPDAPRRRRFPLAAMIAPLGMGLVMYLALHQWQFLLFTLMSPVMALSNTVSDRREAKKEGKSATKEYEEKLVRATDAIGVGLAAETEWRRRHNADAARTLLTATLPTRQLWERRRTDEDALVLRVGTCDLPSELTIAHERASSTEVPEQRTVFAVPVTLPLREIGVLGLAGDTEQARLMANWLLVQLATFHAPRDLGITVLAPKNGADWSWVRWLPHARPGDLDTVAAFVGSDSDTVTSRIVELGQVLKARRAALQSSGRLDRAAFPAQVIVLDGARALRAVPGVSALLEDGPDVGMFALCLETEERLLPEECRATVAIDPHRPSHVAVHATGRQALDDVHVEQMRVCEAELIARAMAPVRDISPEEGETTLPDSARLLDVLALEPPTVDAVRARWQLDGQTTTMTLGVGADGPFALDLRRDGPHGLIAGTTGSGKSELLQTMIAALAVANRPDAMNFVLVDYKGGSAFKDCVRLPHTVGMVTDLDAHLVGRALTSLGAELKRREHQLAAAAVKDIEDYQDLDARTPGGLEPMPRLLLVIDEFASMARELPDFVTGLVNIAQRGRSLGIHLLLATQRPSGVVSPEIRANTNLRISLRVTDAGDSSDVLDANDAARIPKSAPGRGFVRLGHGALLPFQAGRVGGRRPGERSTNVRPPFVAELAWGQLGYLTPQPETFKVKDDDALTDLGVLVDVISEASVAGGFLAQRSPWLEALPESLLLSALDVPPPSSSRVSLVWGLEDVPAEQVQQPRAFDLARDGHLLVVGASRSGRSQLLRTLAGSLSAYSPGDVHVYGLDCGNGALTALKDLPHCGAVINRTESERAVRLFARLLAESERRQGLLASSGFADISEQRAGATPDQRLPHIVVLLDRWEGFIATLGELDSGALTDAVLGLLREGASVGIHLVIAGDRSLTSARISSLTESKVCLRMADKGDVSLLGLHTRDMPITQPPGRAVLVDNRHEVQTAVLVADTSGQAQAAALAERALAARERHPDVPAHLRPFRVDSLPSLVPIEDALALVQKAATPGGLYLPFGIGGDDLELIGVDLASNTSVVVGGPSKSGRSTALCFMARALLAQGTAVVLAAPRPSPLRDLAGLPGVRALITDPGTSLEDWKEALSVEGPLVVLIDDGEGLKDTPGGPLLAEIAKGMAGEGRGLVLAGNPESICTGFTGWQIEVKKGRQGALLSPQDLMNGDLLGLRLPRSVIGQPIVAGRALVHTGSGSLVAVTVPR